ncbi:MAG: PLP-dependent aspartate aminotransferase family protein [Oligoflexales bacterium]
MSRHLKTVAVHAGVEPEATVGAVVPPIFQTSTFAQESPGVHKGYDYSRAGNPTRTAVEDALGALEGARYALSFASGLAAVQAVIHHLQPGDRVLVGDDVYGGTGRLFRTLYGKFQIEFEFLDLNDEAALNEALKKPCRMLWFETPSNPMLKIVDIKKMVERVSKETLVVVDNTFASPIFQNPLAFGADIVLHSCTKYLGGHSDLVGGCVMLNDEKLYEALKYIQFAAGAVPAPFESYLLHRSLKTLAVRMEAHEKNARAVSDFLVTHKKVKHVYDPALPSHPGHDVAQKQMSGFGGMLSFDLNGSFQDVQSFVGKLRVFLLAESLGAVESLVNHPEQMTHASVPEALRKKLGIGPTLLRLSVGIEHQEDLLQDLDQALSAL